MHKKWSNFLDDADDLNAMEQQEIAQIWQVRSDLQMCERGVIMRGKKIVMPKALWGRVVDLCY